MILKNIEREKWSEEAAVVRAQPGQGSPGPAAVGAPQEQGRCGFSRSSEGFLTSLVTTEIERCMCLSPL